MQIFSIGPAGENMVRHANIIFEQDHYAGRGGLGAVLGSKHVKSVAVRGDKKIEFKNPGIIKEINTRARKDFSKSVKELPDSFMGILRRLGTFGLVEQNLSAGNLPTRNFFCGGPDGPEVPEILSRKYAEKEFVGKVNPCRHCYVACKKHHKSKPEYTSLAEYESVAILGSNIGLENDMEKCLEACELCNRLGLDTISTGNIIAWLMECYEKGVKFEKDFDYSISFGEGDKAIELINDIAFRKTELGNILANGIDNAVEAFGPETKNHHRFVKGVGMPAHMPRIKPGVGFAYFHGPNPNDHMKTEHDWIASDPDTLKAFGLETGSAAEALDNGKVEVSRITQIYFAAMDALSMCLFVFGPGNIYSYFLDD